MHDNPEENGHFKLRLDEPDLDTEDRAVPAEINEMRLDKISQRVTLISVMIPVLIVIVLVIAYLDIKKRVVQTEDSGTIEFRRLSSDLESRFSSLSLRQAKLEETLERVTANNDHALASIQVRIEKLQESLDEMRQGALGPKDLNAVKAELVRQINDTAAAASETGRQADALLRELKGQVIEQSEAISTADRRISEIRKNLEQIDTRKIDKQSLDLALRLETLKVETAMKSQIDALQEKIRSLEKQLSQQKPPQSPTPVPPAVQPAPAPSSNSGIEGRTINR